MTSFHLNTKFFTNEPEGNLLSRFRQILKGAEFFDVIVGFFKLSGFFNLYKELEGTMRIFIIR